MFFKSKPLPVRNCTATGRLSQEVEIYVEDIYRNWCGKPVVKLRINDSPSCVNLMKEDSILLTVNHDFKAI